MENVLLLLSLWAHISAFIMGLVILHRYSPEFRNRPCHLMRGLDNVEVSYLTIVLSTLIAPVTIFHLVSEGVNILRYSDTTELGTIYWLGMGVLICLFHVITDNFMGKVRKYGLNNWYT